MSRPLSTFTVDCAGCAKSVTHPYDSNWDFEFRIEQLISKEGWIRRDFSPYTRLWFCGTQCANYSRAALQCEEWWHKYNQMKPFPIYKAVIATVLTIALTIWVSFGFQHLLGR